MKINQPTIPESTFDPTLEAVSSDAQFDFEEFKKAYSEFVKHFAGNAGFENGTQTYQNFLMFLKYYGYSTAHAKNIYNAIQANKNPTIHLGGESIDLGGNTIIGDNEFFIVEACEYRNSFRYLNSDTAVITNIECDHLDYYNNLLNYHVSAANLERLMGAPIVEPSEEL